jgi:hypothetical protein
MNLLRVALLVLTVASIAPSVAAAEIGGKDDPSSLHIHGFVSQGAIRTTKNDYLVQNSTQGSFQLSEVGINFTKVFTDKLRVGMQLFAQNFGWAGNYRVMADWFHLDYRPVDWLGFRAGRMKIPYGLFNEVNDIDSARVPILLPQSVYPLQTRSFLFAQTGFELYGFLRSESAGALEYRLYGGTIFLDPSTLIPPGSGVQVQFNVPYLVGGRILWETPLQGLRMGGSMQVLRLDTTVFLPNAMTAAIENRTVQWVGSAEYAVGELTVSAEYSRWHTKQESALPGNTITNVSERGYGMLTYRAASWLHPGMYYSVLFPDVENRGSRANMQHDVAAMLRFDLTPNWIVKLEGHFMAGTAGLTNPLRVGPPIEGLANYWRAFLVKTTAYF